MIIVSYFYSSIDLLGLYFSTESLFNFLWNIYIPQWLGKVFKFMISRLLENAFVREKTESRHFYSCSPPPSPPGSHWHPQAEENTLLILPGSIFFETCFVPCGLRAEETMTNSYCQCWINGIEAHQTVSLNKEKSYWITFITLLILSNFRICNKCVQ